jgi:GntR family transcriptional regulator
VHSVSDDDPRPPYLQVADHLRSAISSGDLRPGQKLPAQKQLAREYGVAPMTINNAVRLLREQGLLISSHGRGVFVRGQLDQPDSLDEAVPHPDVEELRSDIDDLRRQFGRLEALLIDLYGRTGQPFPRERRPDVRPAKRAAGA